MEELYTAIGDPYFAEPYIDEEGWKDSPVRHYYVHGGFKNTEKFGSEVKFCFYFPEKEKYEGRFYQYLSPAPESERATEGLEGIDDKITFFLTHGAYFVVSNQGGFVPGDGERLYKSSANAAQFSRTVAQRIYGYEHRPYGYCYGGSGGSYKTISCIEVTKGVWDGGVPYVIGNPMATPNVFAPRVRVMRLLGEKGLEKLVDVMRPGGSGDLTEGLDEAQAEAITEATRFGFPKKAWWQHPYMGDGSLMVLAPTIYQVAPTYFQDFWTQEGYAGADPNSTEVRDRVHFKTTVQELRAPRPDAYGATYNSVDNSWMNLLKDNAKTPLIVPAELPQEGSHLTHCRIKVLSGAAAGKEHPIDHILDGVIEMEHAFDPSMETDVFEGLAVGDEILIDNSDYLAMQTFQRHQVPDASYYTYDMYRNEDGTPKYPQLPVPIAPWIAMAAGGSVPNGKLNAKILAVCSLHDESAFPWHGDWYLKRVREEKGDEKDWMRLYFNDYCIHADHYSYIAHFRHIVDYVGILNQALLDLAAWVEKGVEPEPSTVYQLNDGQVEVENSAAHLGLQPAVRSYVNGEKCVHIKAGETVRLTAEIEAPVGIVTEAAWEFEDGAAFDNLQSLCLNEDGSKATVSAEHTYQTPGTYFPVIKVKAGKNSEDAFVQCKNMDMCRVIVEE